MLECGRSKARQYTSMVVYWTSLVWLYAYDNTLEMSDFSPNHVTNKTQKSKSDIPS